MTEKDRLERYERYTLPFCYKATITGGSTCLSIAVAIHGDKAYVGNSGGIVRHHMVHRHTLPLPTTSHVSWEPIQ